MFQAVSAKRGLFKSLDGIRHGHRNISIVKDYSRHIVKPNLLQLTVIVRAAVGIKFHQSFLENVVAFLVFIITEETALFPIVEEVGANLGKSESDPFC